MSVMNDMNGNCKKIIETDVLIVGGGAIGLSCAYSLAKRGREVTVLEQFEFGNQAGSSAGHVRMWRGAVTEKSHAEMAFAAKDLFMALERQVGERILHHHGLLNFGIETDYTEQGTIQTAANVLAERGCSSVRYSASQIEQRFPFKNLPSNYFGYYSKDNAVIDVKVFFKALLKLTQQFGVALKSHENVEHVESDSNGVEVTTSRSIYRANKIVLAPGPYIGEVAKMLGFDLNLTYWNMPFAYYKIINQNMDFPMWFQFDYPDDDFESKLFYGFPSVHFGRSNFIRLAVDWASHKFTDLSDRRFVSEHKDIDLTRRYIKHFMRGVSDVPIDVTSALHVQTPDNLSIFDFAPQKIVQNHKNIVICCAGWAFKFAPLFGEICADLIDETATDWNLSELSILRDGLIKI